MKIVIDNAIPFIKGVFEPYCNRVVYREGAEICRTDLLDADALIIRTRTKCKRELLEGSQVRIIATATIGTDHISPWCEENGIYVKNASGCNAGGVMNYVISSLYGTAARRSIPLAGATLGIIGVGHVGSRVEHAANSLGFKILRCDPPREREEGPSQFVNLDTLLRNSDIVTLHVPLNDSTRAMADAEFFARMKTGAFFINCSRGEVVVEKDLLEARPKLGPVVIDTWCNEPDVNLRLLDSVDIATPHIAGYSYQGKQLGTSLAVRSVARFFNIPELYEFYPPTDIHELQAVKLDLRGKTQGQIASIFQYNYPIFTDDFMFRMAPEKFEELRENYKYRREFYIE